MEEKFYVTEEGLNDLKKELDTLIHVTREEVIEELKAARAQGEARIKELEHQIKNAEVITENKKTNFVRIGSTVEIQELDTKNKLTYKIVGSVEADPLNGLLSNVTPLAEAILDQRVNDVVTVKVDPPYDVKILKIS